VLLRLGGLLEVSPGELGASGRFVIVLTVESGWIGRGVESHWLGFAQARDSLPVAGEWCEGSFRSSLLTIRSIYPAPILTLRSTNTKPRFVTLPRSSGRMSRQARSI
jgi:hypothetical protein